MPKIYKNYKISVDIKPIQERGPIKGFKKFAEKRKVYLFSRNLKNIHYYYIPLSNFRKNPSPIT